MNRIYAISIQLDDSYTQDATIGLYNESGISYLKWSELPLTGVSGSWKSGIIESIGSISKSVNITLGGGVASAKSFRVNLFNNNQLTLTLKDIGIDLNGLICKLYEYVGTDLDSDSEEIRAVSVGEIECADGWDDIVFGFQVKETLHKRKANMGTVIENDKIIPITIGKSDPENNLYFKATRTTSIETILDVESLASGGVSGTNYLNPKMNLFPVSDISGTAPSLTYQIRLGHMDGTALPDGDVFVGKYVLVKEGAGDGVYRKIVSASVVGTASAGIAAANLTVSDYFPVDLAYDWDAEAENQSWVQIIDVEREYKLDDVKCLGFFDSEDNELTRSAELYNEVDDVVERMPEYGCDVDTDNTDKNSLVIDPKLYDGNPDNMLSIAAIPITDFKRCEDTDLSKWGITVTGKIAHGLFYDDREYLFTNRSITETGSIDNITDKSFATGYKFRLDFDYDVSSDTFQYLYYAFTFKLPELPALIKPDNVYLGAFLTIKGEFGVYDTDCDIATISFKKRGYIGRLVDVYTSGAIADESVTATIYNMPDFYLPDAIDSKNSYFYRENETNSLLSGYKLFDLNVNSENYDAVDECLVVIKRRYKYYDIMETTVPGYEEITFKEMCVMIECNSNNVKEAVYV